jgi:menaquinone-9 beta-reductase
MIAAGQRFDVVVVGAGVAGAAVALLASQQNLSVLMVDAQRFPREKVCGGCLNQRAQKFLQRIGLDDELKNAGAVSIDRLHVRIGKQESDWNVPTMLSVRRSTLDQKLIDLGVKCGVTFLEATRAKIQSVTDASCDSNRFVVLKSVRDPTDSVQVECNMVVVASGLTRGSLADSETWPTQVMSESRVGVHALIPRERVPHELSSDNDREKSKLHMLVGSTGYIGICDTDGGFVDLAAAINPGVIRDTKSVSAAVARLLDQCRVEPSFIDGLNWQSTPALTRHSQCVADRRVFLVGDAAGYVEPFTGEGMSWAFKGAESLVPLLYRANLSGNAFIAEQEWNLWITKHRHQRQRISRWVARQSRHTEAAKWVMRVCNWVPPIRNRLLQSIMT